MLSAATGKLAYTVAETTLECRAPNTSSKVAANQGNDNKLSVIKVASAS